MGKEDIKDIFKKRVNELLKESGYTQKELAQDIEATESSVSKYLSGERMPSGEILKNLATALNTTIDYLLGNTNDKNIDDYNIDDIKGLLARHSEEITDEDIKDIIRIIAKY